jgi:hypothetical protein
MGTAWTDVLDGGLDKEDVVNKIHLNDTADDPPEHPSMLRLYAVGTLTIDNGGIETEGFAVGYHPFSGSPAWQNFSEIAGDDTAVDVTSNQAGHVFHVGSTYDYVNQLYDCVIRKINSNTGQTLTSAIYNDPGNAKDLGTAIEVRPFTDPEFPDVYIAGHTTLQVERYLLLRYLNLP